MQYTFQAHDGGYARFLAGESFHLSGDNIYLNPGRDADGNFVYTPFSGLETDRSDYVLGVYLAPIDEFRIISQARFDQSSLDIRQTNIAAVSNYGPISAEVGYTYNADAFIPDPVLLPTSTVLISTPQQELLGQATLRLTDRWSVGGLARYDIDNGGLLYDSVLLKYADECFVLTASYIESTSMTGPLCPIRPLCCASSSSISVISWPRPMLPISTSVAISARTDVRATVARV